jgi:predicted dehydrogenase
VNPPSLQVRYGIIGCGMVSQEHQRSFALLAGAQVTRIFEPGDAMAAASLALAPGARRDANLEEVVASADVDCLLIASPNFCHADQLRQIAAIRPLPVLLEKPACTRLEDVRDLDV